MSEMVVYCDECNGASCICKAARAVAQRMDGRVKVSCVSGVEPRVRAGAILSPAVKVNDRWLSVGLVMDEERLYNLISRNLD